MNNTPVLSVRELRDRIGRRPEGVTTLAFARELGVSDKTLRRYLKAMLDSKWLKRVPVTVITVTGRHHHEYVYRLTPKGREATQWYGMGLPWTSS